MHSSCPEPAKAAGRDVSVPFECGARPLSFGIGADRPARFPPSGRPSERVREYRYSRPPQSRPTPLGEMSRCRSSAGPVRSRLESERTVQLASLVFRSFDRVRQNGCVLPTAGQSCWAGCLGAVRLRRPSALKLLQYTNTNSPRAGTDRPRKAPSSSFKSSQPAAEGPGRSSPYYSTPRLASRPAASGQVPPTGSPDSQRRDIQLHVARIPSTQIQTLQPNTKQSTTTENHNLQPPTLHTPTIHHGHSHKRSTLRRSKSLFLHSSPPRPHRNKAPTLHYQTPVSPLATPPFPSRKPSKAARP